MAQRVGLLGWPVSHSVSAAMFNAVFGSLGMDWHYELLPARPDQLPDRIAALLADGYRGFNVTIPHKQAVLTLPHVTEFEPAVAEIGAANTLTALAASTLRASNTDWLGFAADLDANAVGVQDKVCLILGTGGSAKAVAYALRQLGAAAVVFVSRSPQPGMHDVIAYGALPAIMDRVTLVINCTPVGMTPAIHVSPWPDHVPFPIHAILYDLIYNPPVTRLMHQAQAAGARVIGGLGMLVRQGAASFEQWVGTAPPLDVMESAARSALVGAQVYSETGNA